MVCILQILLVSKALIRPKMDRYPRQEYEEKEIHPSAPAQSSSSRTSSIHSNVGSYDKVVYDKVI